MEKKREGGEAAKGGKGDGSYTVARAAAAPCLMRGTRFPEADLPSARLLL